MPVDQTPAAVASLDRKVLRPPSESDAALTGWKVQRANLIREGSETAAVALAIREDRIIRPSDKRSVTVALPAGFSRREDSDDVEGFHADTPIFKDRTDPDTGETETVALTFREVVTVPITWTVDPRQRWTPRQLLNAAQSAARAERKSIRPRPSEDMAMDAASDVIVRILGREAGKNDDRSEGLTGGAMPYREAITATYLRQAIRGAMLDAIRPNHGAHLDADGDDALADLGDALEGDDVPATLAKAGGDWASGLTDPTADPTAPEWREAYDSLDLSDREAAAATAAIVGVGAAALSAAGVAARSTLKRGRADLRKRETAPIREAFKTARRKGNRPDPTVALDHLITDGPYGHGDPIRELVSLEYLQSRLTCNYRTLEGPADRLRDALRHADRTPGAITRGLVRDALREAREAATTGDGGAASRTYRLRADGTYGTGPDPGPATRRKVAQSGPALRTRTPRPATELSVGKSRPIIPMPDRQPAREGDDAGDALTVAHAPVQSWTYDPAMPPEYLGLAPEGDPNPGNGWIDPLAMPMPTDLD